MQHLGCRRTLTAGTIRAWEQIVISALHCIPEVFGGNKCEFSEHQFPSSRLSVFVRAALLSRHAGIQGLERVQLCVSIVSMRWRHSDRDFFSELISEVPVGEQLLKVFNCLDQSFLELNVRVPIKLWAREMSGVALDHSPAADGERSASASR